MARMWPAVAAPAGTVTAAAIGRLINDTIARRFMNFRTSYPLPSLYRALRSLPPWRQEPLSQSGIWSIPIIDDRRMVPSLGPGTQGLRRLCRPEGRHSLEQ